MPEQNNEVPKDEFRPAPDFVKHYCNNVRFETSIFDLNAVFGELAGFTSDKGSIVDQHVAIRMSWLQAKVMAIFLAINVASHEDSQGPILIPKIVLGEPLHGIADKHMTLEKMFEEIVRVYHAQKPSPDTP